jgi:hypothetical protein
MRCVFLAALMLGVFAVPTLAEVEFQGTQADGAQVYLITGDLDWLNVTRTGKLVVWRGPRKANGRYEVKYLVARGGDPWAGLVSRGSYLDGTSFYTVLFLPGRLRGEQSVDGTILQAGEVPPPAMNFRDVQVTV